MERYKITENTHTQALIQFVLESYLHFLLSSLSISSGLLVDICIITKNTLVHMLFTVTADRKAEYRNVNYNDMSTLQFPQQNSLLSVSSDTMWLLRHQTLTSCSSLYSIKPAEYRSRPKSDMPKRKVYIHPPGASHTTWFLENHLGSAVSSQPVVTQIGFPDMAFWEEVVKLHCCIWELILRCTLAVPRVARLYCIGVIWNS